MESIFRNSQSIAIVMMACLLGTPAVFVRCVLLGVIFFDYIGSDTNVCMNGNDSTIYCTKSGVSICAGTSNFAGVCDPSIWGWYCDATGLNGLGGNKACKRGCVFSSITQTGV